MLWCQGILSFYHKRLAYEIHWVCLNPHYTTKSEQDKEIIMHTKESLLYEDRNIWCKKNSFDVTMGRYDGAEACELIRLYMLSQLQNLDIEVGLYRDDGLATCSKSPRQVEHIKKKMCNFLKILD